MTWAAHPSRSLFHHSLFLVGTGSSWQEQMGAEDKDRYQRTVNGIEG